VSQIVNMSGLFTNATNFDDDISSWNVSSVTNMYLMFFGAYAFGTNTFTSDISNWERISPDVSTLANVIDMGAMFAATYNFDVNIGNWNTSNVINMSQMFDTSINFNQNINSWIVSGVTNMSNMFNYASSFDQPLNSWDVSNVMYMSGMFSHAAAFDRPLNNWVVSNVTDFSYTFQFATLFNQPLNNWQVQYANNFQGMFNHATAFDYPLDGWNIGYAQNMTDFMTGKDSTNYSIQNTTSLLQSWSSQSLQPSVTLDLGNIDILITDLPYIASLTGSPNNWTVNFGNVVTPSPVCVASAGTTAVNGTYLYSGQEYGRNYYMNGIYKLSWVIGFQGWVLRDTTGGGTGDLYGSVDDVLTPDQITSWLLTFNGASLPYPTLTSGSC
jgi:surface protein